MTTVELNKKIGAIVEQKIVEFFGDPDNKLVVNKSFLAMLKQRTVKKQKFISHTQLLKHYGFR